MDEEPDHRSPPVLLLLLSFPDGLSRVEEDHLNPSLSSQLFLAKVGEVDPTERLALMDPQRPSEARLGVGEEASFPERMSMLFKLEPRPIPSAPRPNPAAPRAERCFLDEVGEAPISACIWSSAAEKGS